MKKLLLFVSIIFIFSCSDDEVVETLEGKWNLVNVTCLCEPINLDLGEQIWNFNTANNSIIVTNNVDPLPHTLLTSGTYTYQVSGNTITLESVDYVYKFDDGKLSLDSGIASDSPLLTFKRD